MITLPPAVRVFVHLGPTDMRRSLDGLAGMVREIIRADPLSGHLFVFFNRRRDRVKVLFWDRTGLALWYKKLETEDTHIFGCTEVERRAYNRHIGVAEAGRMVGISRESGSRRSIMPRQGSLFAPPRARWPRESYRSTNSGRS